MVLIPIVSLILFFIPTAGRAQAPKPISLAEAVALAASKNPGILIARENWNDARGAAISAGGQFDWILHSNISRRLEHTPYTEIIERKDDIVSFSVGMSKTFGFGLRVEPSVELARVESIIPAVVSGTVAAQNLAVVRLRMTQPLLRRFGSATSAAEDAVLKFAAAGELDFQHTISESVAAAAGAYWEYAGALRNMEILTAAEQRAGQILSDVRALVAADERPKGDLELLEANLADRGRARLEGEQALAEAKAALVLALGLSSAELEALGAASTPLPETAAPAAANVENALARRWDLRAAEQRLQGAEILVAAAENGEKPQLDLIAELGYAGIVAGDEVSNFFAPIGKNIPGANVNVALSFRWPIGDSTAEGDLIRAAAARRRAEIARDAVERSARTGLTTALVSVKSGGEAMLRAQKATAHHRSSLENERTKLKSGISTIIDVILTEDRMTAALLADNVARVRHARALARLAHEAASLTRATGEKAEIDLKVLAPSAR